MRSLPLSFIPQGSNCSGAHQASQQLPCRRAPLSEQRAGGFCQGLCSRVAVLLPLDVAAARAEVALATLFPLAFCLRAFLLLLRAVFQCHHEIDNPSLFLCSSE